MKKINKNKLPSKIRNYEKPALPEVLINFSFQFLDNDHDDFNLKEADTSYISDLLERFKNISTLRTCEFRGEANKGNSKAIRSHQIEWEKTSYKNGFSHLPKQYEAYEPRQFSISKANGRVHGFLRDNVFFVVWFDPKHKLYP